MDLDPDPEEDQQFQKCQLSRNGVKREHPFHLAHLAALVLELALEKQTQKPAKTIQSWTDQLMWSQL